MSPPDPIETILGSHEPVAGPWIRNAARMTDMMLVSLAFSFADVLFDWKMSRVPEIVQAILITLAWLPLEGILLTIAGTTPGKALYGLSVLGPGPGRLRFGNALRRSVLVMMFGVGLGIPILASIALLANFWKFSKSGTTLWDRASGSIERRRPIKALQLAGAIAATFGLAFLVLQSRLEGLKPPHVSRQAAHVADLAIPNVRENRSAHYAE